MIGFKFVGIFKGGKWLTLIDSNNKKNLLPF
jgi:hypothetical protein